MRKRLSRARQTVREELLARFGEFARASAPSVGFTAMVATALGIASPPAAAAGILTTAAGAAGAKTLGKILLGAAGSIGIAIVAALAGVWLGLRQQLKGAIDQTERVGLIRIAVVNALASIAFVAFLVVMHRITVGPLPILLVRWASCRSCFSNAWWCCRGCWPAATRWRRGGTPKARPGGAGASGSRRGSASPSASVAASAACSTA